jgi:hypothetical protein
LVASLPPNLPGLVMMNWQRLPGAGESLKTESMLHA